MANEPSLRGPALAGLKVLEIAQLIAGPMAGSLLADLGADVVHVEDPLHGDPQRVTGAAKDGVYLWWKVSGRNKRLVTLDLRTSEGQGVAHKLVAWADVVICNFRVPTLKKWHLDWDALQTINPKLVMLQVSGFGAETALADQPGFGKVGEAMSGVVHLTGFPDGPPVHTGFSHGDSTTGMFGAYAIMAALYRRDHDPDFDGEWIDMTLYESLFRMCEWQVIMFDQLGEPPMRAGNRLANAPAPVVNTYQAGDGTWITVTSGTPRSITKVAALLGEPADDYDTVTKQAAKKERLDQLLREYIGARPSEQVLDDMIGAEVTASRIYSARDICEDETYRERGTVVEVDDPDLGKVRMQAALPKMANHGGTVWRTGGRLGEDNDLVYREYLGLDADELAGLRDRGVI
jgi:formyl-CoA transferase